MADIRKIQRASVADTPRSQFNMSHNRKHTQKMCDLVPNDMIAYTPADRLKGRIATAFNFPPLLSPAYQGFSQKSYMFKIRKGLTWHNDGIKSQLRVLQTGQQSNINEPSMRMTSGAYFGSNLYCVRFCPKLPVYGERLGNGQTLIYLPSNNGYMELSTISVNQFLSFSMYGTDVLKEMFKNMDTMFHGFFTSQEANGIESRNPIYLSQSLGQYVLNNSDIARNHNANLIQANLAFVSDAQCSDPLRGCGQNPDNCPGIIGDLFYDYNVWNKRREVTNDDFQKTATYRSYTHYMDVTHHAEYPHDFSGSKRWYNPKGLDNFHAIFVNDGPCQSYKLMESLGYPSFNWYPYISQVNERICKPLSDNFEKNVKMWYDGYVTLYNKLHEEEGTQASRSKDVYEIIRQYQNLVNFDTVQNTNRWLDVTSAWNNCAYKQPYLDIKTIGFAPGNSRFQLTQTDLYTMLYEYAIWCIENGYGDGSIPPDEDCPIIYARPVGDLFPTPFTKQCTGDVDYVNVSLCPWLAYWHVYENYFRDANVSQSLKPLLQKFQVQNAPSLNDPNVSAELRKSNSDDYITHMGRDFSMFPQEEILIGGVDYQSRLARLNGADHLNTSPIATADFNYKDNDSYLGTTFAPLYSYHTSDQSFNANCRRLIFGITCENEMFEHPRKLLDKDIFTSLLPTTSKIEVFAPTMSQTDISTFLNAKDKTGFFAQYEEIMNQQTGNEIHSSQPISLDKLSSMGNTSTLLSVDAFRTAETLQNYYRNCSLVGDQINQFIYLTFGVHSKDFRPEVPELVFARETPCHITELTQQSETAELPIGSEAGKMSSSSDTYNFEIDSDGDFGYVIYMTCVYPETSQEPAYNPLTLVSNNFFNQMFVPQFSKLGEEGITNLFIDATPRFNISGDGVTSVKNKNQIAADIDRIVGYAPRYTMFKFIPNTITGRFKSDMNYWTLDRLYDPFSDRTKLNDEYLRSKRDLRIFASDEEQNCYGFTMCQLEVLRALASSSVNSII